MINVIPSEQQRAKVSCTALTGSQLIYSRHGSPHRRARQQKLALCMAGAFLLYQEARHLRNRAGDCNLAFLATSPRGLTTSNKGQNDTDWLASSMVIPTFGGRYIFKTGYRAASCASPAKVLRKGSTRLNPRCRTRNTSQGPAKKTIPTLGRVKSPFCQGPIFPERNTKDSKVYPKGAK